MASIGFSLLCCCFSRGLFFFDSAVELAALQEFLADMEDLMDLSAAKEEDADRFSVSLTEAKKMLEL